jgi:hypothetical protein
MERHVFPADDSRCQQRRELQLCTGINHRTALSNLSRTSAALAICTRTNHGTAFLKFNQTWSACWSSLRPYWICGWTFFNCELWFAGCVFVDLFVYLLNYLCICWLVDLSCGLRLVVWHKFHFCSRTAVSCYVWRKLQRFCFVTDVISYTGCFTTLGHNCRRWFPRSLWWKMFI